MTQARRDPIPNFLDIATNHLSRRVAQALADLSPSWTPPMMAAACGGAQSGWRSKVNGTRLFQLSDLVALTAATGTDMFTAVAIESRDQLVAEVWRPHLIHRDKQVPLLRGPDQLWTDLGETLADWLAAETRAGRGPLVTRDVFLHHLLAALDGRGMPSAAALIEQSASRTTLSWSGSGSTVTIDYSVGDLANHEQRATTAPVKWSFGTPHVAVSIVLAAGNGSEQPRLLSYAVEPRR